MYAVIKTGGKQYKVIAGEKIKVEKLETEVGAKVVIDKVLMNHTNEAIIEEVADAVNEMMSERPIFVF